MSSVWFTNVLLIQVNKVSECDFSHSTFSIFSSRSLAEILSQHSLNCDRKESRWYLCSSQALGAGEGLRVENTSREKGEKAEETECSKANCAYRPLFLEMTMSSDNQEASLFLHFLIHTSNLITDLHGPVPARF